MATEPMAALTISTRQPMPKPVHPRADSVTAPRPLPPRNHLQPAASEGATFSIQRPPQLRPNITHTSLESNVMRMQLLRRRRLHSLLLRLAPASGLPPRKTSPALPPTVPPAGVALPPSLPKKLIRPILPLTALVLMHLAAMRILPAPTMSLSIGTSVASEQVMIGPVPWDQIITHSNHPATRVTQATIIPQRQLQLQHGAPLRPRRHHLMACQAQAATGSPHLGLCRLSMPRGGPPRSIRISCPLTHQPACTSLPDLRRDPVANPFSLAPLEQRARWPLPAKPTPRCHRAPSRHPVPHQRSGEAVRTRLLQD